MKNNVIEHIVQVYGTPSYVFDTDMLLQRMDILRECIGNRAALCYAMKANPFYIKPLEGIVERFEVCSPGEYRICQRENISADKLVLSGVYKEKADIWNSIILNGQRGLYTVESLQQARLLTECAEQAGTVVDVLLRLTSGNQFGMDEKDIEDMVRDREKYQGISIRGIQWYSGTQKKKMSKIAEELERLDNFLEMLKDRYNFSAVELEYGPGLYIPYFEDYDLSEDRMMLQRFGELLDKMRFRGRIILEMGRYIAALTGYYITSIVDKKCNGGENYCIIDGGIHHINYYGQTMGMRIPPFRHMKKEQKESPKTEWNICGSLCTVGDVVVKKLSLDSPEVNDVLMFERVGAYSVTEGIYLFLSRDLPHVLFYSEDNGVKIAREKQPIDYLNSWSGGAE